MKRLLCGRRGAAMMTALMFMVVLATMSLLLLSAVTLAHSEARYTEEVHATRLELEQIGEYFCTKDNEVSFWESVHSHSLSLDDAQIIPDYTANTLTVESKRGGRVLLYIKCEGVGEERAATSWRYSAPENDS